GPDQLRHQGGGGAREMQRCCTPKMEIERAMVLRFSGDQGLRRAGEDPYEACRHRGRERHGARAGQEYLQPGAAGRVCAIPGEPGNATRILG
ncbi:MAG: hypothetical protein ACK55I_10420, partial [bacterium]